MLDSVTKKRIDDLRNILVGKIPSPQSQVEQITTGLIYKFMYDMDNEAIKMGGVPSFFVDEFEKYSWKHLFNSKLGGVQKVKLYSDAIENLYNNPHAPLIFREIFKNSFLPFKDPSTLNMFLKEINEFDYSNSEKLGDAYEYLLSFMGSQGDAGQFRTPRHIIDFIIEIVNPQKNETILDPACGSSGFLISSYKHILKQNTQIRIGDQLNAKERKKIGENLVGYDIDPAMTRISLVNMYLHNFTSPNISEYDSLSSEDKWNDYFDVILANPPFFSPTGGIKPHSRFGVKSTRAEVLFVDYIIEHLKPNGRAGIIIPEGIIFQTGTAYKTLRKKLVEDSLVGVVSLPAGVFQPYSGVKTSILILDKEKNKNSETIFFAKVENDGYSLGSQRKPIEKNDLPKTISKYVSWKDDPFYSESYIQKNKILESEDCSLLIGKYQEINYIQSNFLISSIKEVCNVSTGKKDVNSGNPNGLYPFFTCAKENTYSNEYSFDTEALLIAGNGEVGRVSYYKGKFEAYQRTYVLDDFSNILPRYLYFVLQTRLPIELDKLKQGNTMPYIKVGMIKDFKFPLPSIELQTDIVNELEGYQKIINGCQQIVSNYKPTIEIDPSWEMIELGEMATTQYGTGEKSLNEGKYAVLRMGNLQGGEINFSNLVYSNNYDDFKNLELFEGDILFNRTNSPDLVGKASIYRGYSQASLFAGYLIRVKVDKKRILPEYLNAVLNSPYGQKLNDKNVSISGNQANINATKLRSYPIPTPSLETQKSIVKSIEVERSLVNSNKELLNIFSQKIQDKIQTIWS